MYITLCSTHLKYSKASTARSMKGCKPKEPTLLVQSQFLSHSCGDAAIGRGGQGDTACLRWLDGKEDRSVVLFSFGSQCYFKSEQLHELAKGLADSGRNFLWVVKGENMEEWMPFGCEDPVAGRGFVVKGWAPQVAILAHPAIGAFMTHCGWNSILEGISAGVPPMLTWPLAAEQFFNERLMVEVIHCATRVWDGARSMREAEKELVPGSTIACAVSKFMEPKGEHVALRAIVQHVAALAQAAVEEGGTSRGNLKSSVNDLIAFKGK